ncbi:MAG: hypothetical protein IRZ09_07620 [Variibacter sp.]|nr:hypothetical protein [Variibacter sp.]
MGRNVLAAAIFAALNLTPTVGLSHELVAAGAARGAGQIDSEHLFGFTEGTDIGHKGDRELELEAEDRSGKRGGRYNVLGFTAEGKFSLTDDFRIAPGFSLVRHDISGVPGFLDRSATEFEGAHLEMKYRVLDRARGPFGLTLAATPRVSRVDEASGALTTEYGADFLVSADKEVVPGTLFAAANLRYGPSAVREGGVWMHESELEVSGALAVRMPPRLFVGGEVRYRVAYEGLALNRFAGEGVFIGPTLYARLSERAWIAGAWSAQIAGHARREPGSLDLTNFERHEFKVRFGHEF